MAHPAPDTPFWLTDPDVTSYATAGCVTIVVGMGGNEALKAMGSEPNREVPVAEARGGDGLNWVSLARPEDGLPESSVVLIEDNGWEGVRPEVLKGLSKRGKAASVYWNVNGVVTFACAGRGKLKASVELPDPEDIDDVPATLRRIIEKASDDTDPVAVGLAMAQRFTGVTVPRVQDVIAPEMAHPITRPILGLRVTRDELVSLKYPREDVVVAVLAADGHRRRSVAAWAARHALEKASLTELPQLAPMLVQLEFPEPTRPTAEASAFRSLAHRNSLAAGWALSVESDMDRWNELRHWNAKSWAMEALAYTASTDDVTAALGSIYCASIPYRGLAKTANSDFLRDAIDALNA